MFAFVRYDDETLAVILSSDGGKNLLPGRREEFFLMFEVRKEANFRLRVAIDNTI